MDKLFNIPSIYFTEEGLSYIASFLVVPLYAGNITSEARGIDFAKVCLEMNVGSSFPAPFSVETKFGEIFQVDVEYIWIPKQCAHCKIFGHISSKCAKAPVQVWKQKDQDLTTKMDTTPNEWVDFDHTSKLRVPVPYYLHP